jgi:hypothetical protein
MVSEYRLYIREPGKTVHIVSNAGDNASQSLFNMADLSMTLAAGTIIECWEERGVGRVPILCWTLNLNDVLSFGGEPNGVLSRMRVGDAA